jgi:rRNA biogenesis protein RRP5
VESDDDDDDQ